jgi:hypothetical protein
LDRVQLVSILGAGGLLLCVLELVRRRRLLERYALLWLLSGAVILGLAVWGGLLQSVSDLVGIAYPPSTLFVIAFVFVLVLLLHFSIAVSRLTDQTKVLAQRLALLEEEVRSTRRRARSHVAGERQEEDDLREEEPASVSGS